MGSQSSYLCSSSAGVACCGSCGGERESSSSSRPGAGFKGRMCRCCGTTPLSEVTVEQHDYTLPVAQEPTLVGVGMMGGLDDADVDRVCIPATLDLAIDELLGKRNKPRQPGSSKTAQDASLREPFQGLLASKVVVSSSESFFLATGADGESRIVHSVASFPLEERHEVTLEGGIRYHGQWRGSDRHGYGVLQRPDGLRYEGQFVDNHVHGNGILYNKDGKIVYQGQWEVGRAQGRGRAWQSDGSSYDGEWLQDRKSGRGTESWPDGAAYEGEFMHGAKNGFGQYRSNTGAVYRGEFRNDKVEGEGMYTFPDGRIYSGQCKAGTMNGTGNMQWPNGSKYQGGYVNGAKSGEGTFTWPDGRIYWGQWSEGLQEGFGVTISADGVASQGVWRSGRELEAQGTWQGTKKMPAAGNYSPSMASRSLVSGGLTVAVTPSPSEAPSATNEASAPDVAMPRAAHEMAALKPHAGRRCL
mmetsp:Transcript_42089/g.94618  ORF Transcript_42089/g.94618 Transcript_42089/m.94618 type:complete len:471 (+) Transcript_42089:163-1575(+)